jgi:hypothetical protein
VSNCPWLIQTQIPLGQNIHTTSDSDVSDGTYAGFIVLTFLGAILTFALVDGKNVVRNDGSHVILMKHPSWSSEIFGLWEVFLSDPYIVMLFPMFFASNWFYTYQFNDVNLAHFNTRTRALNSTLYWSAQIVGAVVFGYALDLKFLRRTLRAKAAWVALVVLTFVIWGGGYAFQKGYTRSTFGESDKVFKNKTDWTDSGYVGPMFLYIFYGFYDAAWQTTVYW